MNTEPKLIDPTDPVFSYSHDPREPDTDAIESMRDGFENAREHFPMFMDITVAIQLYMDIAEMADIRFHGLFDHVLEDLVEAAETYDDAYPEVERHVGHGESALPNWEATIGLKLDDSLLIDDPTARERAQQFGQPMRIVDTIGSHRPVIQHADLAALYHTYHSNNGKTELVCSYLDESFLEYDYCMFIRQVDLRDFEAPPVYYLAEADDEYRRFLAELMESKALSLFEADQTMNLDHVFAGYAAPLAVTVRDIERLQEDEPEQ